MALYLCGLLAMLASMQSGLPAGNRQNILMILVDDLKPALGCYGDLRARSPHIDRLASRGAQFEMAYCNQSVCAPSRNNLFVGQRSTTLGIYSLHQNFRLAAPEAITLPQQFSINGYKSIGLGKTFHVGHGNQDDPASWSVPPMRDKVIEYLLDSSTQGGQLTREEAYFSNRDLDRIGSLPRGAAWEKSDVGDTAYADGRTAEMAIHYLQESAAYPETPFFMALGFVRPHLPFTPPARYWDLHDPRDWDLPSDPSPPLLAPDYARKRGGEIVNYSPLSVDNLQNPDIQRQLLHGYYASVSYVDSQIGKVMDELDRLGLSGNTIVVLWGDHGWHLGDHGFWTKHTNYEQANRIPLIVVAPGISQPGTRIIQPVETVDIYPTLCDLAGIPIQNGTQPLDGMSLVPLLKSPQSILRAHAYHCFPRGGKLGRAIRTSRYRLIEWRGIGQPDGPVEYELYDYDTDPHEKENLASRYPQLVRQIALILKAHPEPIQYRAN